MRVLDTTTFELHSGDQSQFKREKYAILSHRWVGNEITIGQLKDVVSELRSHRTPASTPQIDKIRGACKTARELGYRYLCIDSCCIDKSNAVELDRSLNSMLQWYSGAEVCITYLGDVDTSRSTTSVDGGQGPDIFDSIERKGPSLWFSRGWTLQELLAPRDLRFYDRNWDFIDTKQELADAIAHVTGIEADYLTGRKNFRTACIAAKMSWLAGRTTTETEDIAYSMLGIFGVRMNTRYSEGTEAFMRLQRELLTAPNLPRYETLFAWRMPDANAGLHLLGPVQDMNWQAGEWGLLAASHKWFKDSGGVTLDQAPPIQRPAKGFGMAGQGSVLA
ncbi:Uu.00g025380.m01.CDS01 [Anthostomella pinea]|uniref:Uu.00g025380.m01.CDS01 n=1 Tax=Anthostomella pinea TaxID=933095 RepID=A0AAI8V7C9_9PEZI|nr:Uu.00g025380.m01.CDS01 [Anthostomella pinea]